MEKLKKKIINFYNSLDLRKKMLISIIIVIFLSVLYYGLVADNYRESEINYDEINVDSIIGSSSIVYDRGKIKTLDEILKKIFKVHYGTYYIDDEKVTVKDIYNDLIHNTYSKELSYGKFKTKIEEFYDNILKDTDVSSLDYNSYIDLVYYSNDLDMYLIQISHYDDSETKSYLGVRLFESDLEFKIMYIE